MFESRLAEHDRTLERVIPNGPIVGTFGVEDVSSWIAVDGKPLGSRGPWFLIGSEQREPGYLELSLGSDYLQGDFLVHVALPAGSHGLWLNDPTSGHLPWLRLPRGSSLRVERIRPDDSESVLFHIDAVLVSR